MCSAAVVNHPFRLSGGSGSIIQTDRLPFILREIPFKIFISGFQKRFVIHFPKQFSAFCHRIIDVNHQRRIFQLLQDFLDDWRKFPIRDQHLRFSMLQNVGQSFRFQPNVERVQHSSGHQNAEMGLKQLRNVGRHHRNRSSLNHSFFLQC